MSGPATPAQKPAEGVSPYTPPQGAGTPDAGSTDDVQRTKLEDKLEQLLQSLLEVGICESARPRSYSVCADAVARLDPQVLATSKRVRWRACAPVAGRSGAPVVFSDAKCRPLSASVRGERSRPLQQRLYCAHGGAGRAQPVHVALDPDPAPSH